MEFNLYKLCECEWQIFRDKFLIYFLTFFSVFFIKEKMFFLFEHVFYLNKIYTKRVHSKRWKFLLIQEHSLFLDKIDSFNFQKSNNWTNGMFLMTGAIFRVLLWKQMSITEKNWTLRNNRFPISSIISIRIQFYFDNLIN